MTVLVLALAAVVILGLAVMCGYFAYRYRLQAEAAEKSAARWREAAHARAENGQGHTEVLPAVTDDEAIGWAEAQELLDTGGAR